MNNNYGCKCVAITTVASNKNDKTNKQGGKIRDITRFLCKTTGHYSNKCAEDLPKSQGNKGSNMPIMENDFFDDDDRKYLGTTHNE